MGLRVLRSCCSSQGQPFGPRSVATISTSFSNFVPVIPYNHNPMKVVSQLSDTSVLGPSVLTIGNFDGLHLGHQQILKTVVERARKLRMCPAVFTFDPHPLRVLAPEQAPK